MTNWIIARKKTQPQPVYWVSIGHRQVPRLTSEVRRGCGKGVALWQGCLKGVARVSQGCRKGVSRVIFLHPCYF